MEISNWKGLLLEICVKNNRSMPKFETAVDSGPPHDPVFVCKVSIDDELVVEAKAKSKKSAEREAAKLAWQALGNLKVFQKPNYTSLLYELSQKIHQDFSFIEVSHEGPAHNLEFTFKVKFGDDVFPQSSPKRTKTQAKNEAAYHALQELRKKFPNELQTLSDVFIDDTGSENSSLSGRKPGECEKGDMKNNHYFGTVAPSLSCTCCIAKDWSCRPESAYCEANGRQWSQNPLTIFAIIRQFPHKDINKKGALILLYQSRHVMNSLPYIFMSIIIDAVNNDCIQPSPESGLHTSETPYFKSQSSSSDLTPSNVQRGSKISQSISEPPPYVTVGAEGSLQSSSSTISDLNILQSPLAEFTLTEKLGKGAFGHVVKAKKILDDRFYAVKRVEVRDKKVLQEVKALAVLKHSNIVRYYNAWLGEHEFVDSSSSGSNSSDFSRRSRTSLFIQMELCEKGSLKDWIKNRNLQNKVNKSECFKIFRQIIEGVRYIHSKKLIHRDLKVRMAYTRDQKLK
ncbi:regulation of hematopoietic stem cell proliferation, partial [Pristimantis euphronides]